MTSFPIFERLTVEGYGLYPGTRSRPGLDVAFEPGLTLVLGANGLGKTTLVNLLYRMCAGPYDITGLDDGSELGTRSLDARRLRAPQRRLFAVRVTDGARDARATLAMRLGEAQIVTTRAMDSLELLDLQVNGEPLPATDAQYHEVIKRHAGLAAFGDWILLLRHITFYFEDRRALVWDHSAQRHILRLLFLPPRTARQWTSLEREVLRLDSAVRNLRTILTREEEQLGESELAVTGADAVRRELRAAQRTLRRLQPRLDELEDRLVGLRSDAEDARVAALQANRDRAAASSDLERQQLLSVAAAFPSRDATARYLIAKLFGDGHCLACGTDVETAADRRRPDSDDACVICGSHVPRAARRPARKRIEAAEQRRAMAVARWEVASEHRHLVDAELSALVQQAAVERSAVARLEATIDALVQRLPGEQSELKRRRRELAGLRLRWETMSRDLDALRASFVRFIRGVNRDIAQRKEQIEETFNHFASDFLFEDCKLVWTTHKARIGQSGEQIDFPGFELEVGGAGFTAPVRRKGPQQVSESQREFIDLSFRMSLMVVASEDQIGTLVIDAPESSLDAVFVRRAADVLTRFAAPQLGNRLAITSNLIEGALIPELARYARIVSPRDERVVDLLELAAPTAATSQLHDEYVEVRRDLFARARRERT